MWGWCSGSRFTFRLEGCFVRRLLAFGPAAGIALSLTRGERSRWTRNIPGCGNEGVIHSICVVYYIALPGEQVFVSITCKDVVYCVYAVAAEGCHVLGYVGVCGPCGPERITFPEVV